MLKNKKKEKEKMNLVERLIAIDKKKFDEVETKTLKSKKIEFLLGEEANITIQALEPDQILAFQNSATDKKGNLRTEKLYDMHAKIVAAGLVEPSLKDSALLSHLKTATPAEAAKKIFRGETIEISNEIIKLSGLTPEQEEEEEEEIKN